MTTLLLSRAAARGFPSRFASLRCLSTGPIPADVDHYVSGWTIQDIDEFTRPGRFNVRTFNNISPKVGKLVEELCVGLIIGRCKWL